MNAHLNSALILLDRALEEIENGFVACERCGDQEDTKDLDFVDDLKVAKEELVKLVKVFPTQDPKYGIKDNRLVNMTTGKPIPEDEPVMLFRAKDLRASDAIYSYGQTCRNKDHFDAVGKRYLDFRRFAAEHPERINEPDTAATN